MALRVILLTLLVNSAACIKRSIINSPNAPGAIGPYSQGVVLTFKSGEVMVQAAGQIGLDPKTGELVPGGITNQTHQVMQNIKAIMNEAGAKMSEIVECTVLMADLSMYSELNEVYGKYFEASNAPARAAFQVVALPKGALTEIKCSAAIEN